MAKREVTKRATAKRTPRPKLGRRGPAKLDPSAEVPVVTIGASAGGLEPIGQFLSAMSADSGLAFVVIQHLDPKSKSMLPDLLARHTAMPVHSAEDGVALAPNQVYVIPPGVYLSIASGRLQFAAAPAGRATRVPIDAFLYSLAADRGKRGVGIIMSGTGTDGAQGLRALKEAGGLVLVQDPNEAQQDGMPRYAIRMARPDHVLPVREMPPVLLRYIAHDYVNHPSAAAAQVEEPIIPGELPLEAFVAALKAHTGQDFELYKSGTLRRRVERRMALHAIVSFAEYLRLVKESKAEAEALANDLLINVTEFFRDPGAFERLENLMVGRFQSRRSDEPVRIWVAGCSTGEEAYSLGIVLLEQIAAAQRHLALQIFATDIDDEALQIARAGVYAESSLAKVSTERLTRYFVQEDQHFRVVKPLREAVIFSHHDVLRDPPFSKMDLISCRNLLIYLKPDAQHQVLTLLNFALRDDGLLFLGSAESVSAAGNLFEPVDDKFRIYRRSGRAQSTRPRQAALSVFGGPDVTARPAPSRTPSLADVVQSILLESYTPAAVVADRHFLPLYYFGASDRYLKIIAGEPTQDVLAMAREGLRPKLRETIVRAFRSKRRVVARGVWFERHGKRTAITIEAQRLTGEHNEQVLVSFIEDALPPDTLPHKRSKVASSAEVLQLRQELADARRELNRTIHDLRRANEELKAKNQEAMSQNEEFLSTNEELQSSKEELQSLNEELSTVNNQLRNTLDQQQQTSTDLSNILNSSAVATIFLDAELRIKAFNPRMKSLFSLIDTDIGRPLADLVPKFADPELLDDATAARAEGRPSEREIRAQSGAWYNRSSVPYLTETGQIEGAVVTFADVSRLKQAELDAAAARSNAETIIDTIAQPLVVLHSDLIIESANAAFASSFHVTRQGAVGRGLPELRQGPLDDRQLAELLTQVASQQQDSAQIDVEVEWPQTGYQVWRAIARRFHAQGAEQPRILLALSDVTDERRIIRRQLRLMVDALPGAILAVDKERQIRLVSSSVEAVLGYKAEELEGRHIDLLVPPELRAKHAEWHASFIANPLSRAMGASVDIQAVAKDGQRIPVDIGLCPVPTADGLLVVAVIHDLRLQKQNEMQLREAKGAADRANQAKSRFLAAASHDLRQPLQIMELLHNVLRQKISEPEAATILGRLENTVTDMTELLDTLLDVNQIESGAISACTIDVPLAVLFTRAREEFRPLAAAKGLTLHVVDAAAVIRSDRHLLLRMLDNLLSNAIKYTVKGKILLGCRRRGDRLRIEVWDTGVGIPPEHIDAVFDEFYRLNHGDDGRFGLGLGLYIVRQFAKLLGYEIEVRSTPGKGTMFGIILPIASLAQADDSVAKSPDDPADPLILLVEDDAILRDTLTALLESEGYSVAVAPKGEAALKLLGGAAGIQPDLVIADYNLPGEMTGLELIQRIRTELRPQIEAFIVSGDKRRATLQQVEAAGLMLLCKPFKAEDLLAAAQMCLGRAQFRALAQARSPMAPPGEPPMAGGSDVAIIDDEFGVREALRLSLEAKGFGVTTYDTAEAFLADSDHQRFRCLVVDVVLPGMDGLALQSQLKAEHLQAPLILMTGGRDVPLAVRAMRDGAADFLQKPVSDAALGESVARALDAGAQSANYLAEANVVVARLAKLTPRERDVMEQMMAGEANKNIANNLGVSQRTIEHHRQSVMRKMGAKSLAILVRMVMSHVGPGTAAAHVAPKGD